MNKLSNEMHACSIYVKDMDINNVVKLSKRLKTLGYTPQWVKSLGHITHLYIHLFMHVVCESDGCIYIEDKVDSISLAEWCAKNNGSLSICL